MRHTFVLILIFISNSLTINAQEVLSPNKNIKVILSSKNLSDNMYFGQVYIKILHKKGSEYIEVLPDSPLGLIRADEKFSDNLKLIGESKAKEIYDKYEMICGKRKMCENFGTEKVFKYINSNNQTLNIVFRVYNNGVAFRYIFPNHSDSLFNITDEATTFVLPENTSRWMQPYNIAYEDFYPINMTGKSSEKNQEWGLPALYKVNDNPIWVLISEANISEKNCGTKLLNQNNLNEYKVSYPPERDDFNQIGVITSLPWKSQWHTLIIGKLSDIVESTLITDLSEPNKLKDTDWIKPGPVAWIYWANNHGSKDYQKVVEYVDLAADMKWPYVLIDWEWDVMSNGGTIIDAVNYAENKGIKPLMWYNSGTSWLEPTPNDRLLTAKKRAEEFSWLNKIGVFGIKVDFFAGDQQDVMKFYINILEEAAKFNLMVNFHGATIPRGWARTYPNLMTIEGVYGAEWYNNLPVLTDKAAVHNTTLPFTRNVVGSMDYTPVTFSNSQHPHITSYGHELALSVVFESGLQHFADRPTAYNSLPSDPKEFLKNVPVSWDDTKLIDGYPGEKVIIARKKGSQWYVGGLNGKDEAQKLEVNFDFLGEGNYHLKLIKDGKDDKSFETELVKVRKGDTLEIECLPRGGFVGSLKDITEEFRPRWNSINERPVPEWFTDAKFGIFIHWGVYSVPSYRGVSEKMYDTYAEWYEAKVMHDTIKNGQEFHRINYGADFEYRDFAPMFKAELWDPEYWAELFKRSGAKYVVLTSKHHDGFCLFNAESPYSENWNSMDIGPKRDLLKELGEAVITEGLKMGIYYSLMEWESTPRNHEWSGGLTGFYLPDSIIEKYGIKDPDFVDKHILPQLKQLVMDYQPALIFSDGEWDKPDSYWRSEEFLAWLYNYAPNKEEVVVNDRWGSDTRGKHGGYFTSEYSSDQDKMSAEHPWEESRGMGKSYGYNRAENIDDYNSSEELLFELISIVSRGGNLLLNIGPDADGTIPVIMQQRLSDIGKWLEINGEAVYGTSVWKESPQTNDYFFTKKDKDLYVLTKSWPGKKFAIEGIDNRPGDCFLLGHRGGIKIKHNKKRTFISIPDKIINERLCQPIYVFKIENAFQPGR